MSTILIKNATIINEDSRTISDVLIRGKKIEKIDRNISTDKSHDTIEAEGLFLIPGLIDDQVHFREPGLTDKGNIFSESRAAVAGGITSYMEMPNVSPSTTDIKALE